MDLTSIRTLITVPDEDMVPPPSLFWHPSYLHGQAHVARVLVHALRLVEATGFAGEAVRLWASVYLHDIARRHDGHCKVHGADAWARLGDLPDLRARLARGGVVAGDHEAIAFAVSIHCNGEPSQSDPHYRLAALLKDADGLDRVRLGDLKSHMLRHPAARQMVPFAQRLHDDTNRVLKPGPDYFARLWPAALQLL